MITHFSRSLFVYGNVGFWVEGFFTGSIKLQLKNIEV